MPEPTLVNSTQLAEIEPLLRIENPYNRADAPVLVTGELTLDGSIPSTPPINPLTKTGEFTWEGDFWTLTDGGGGNWTLLDGTTGSLWYGVGANVEDAVWTPDTTETGSPLVTPQFIGLPGQSCIVDDGVNPSRVFVNAITTPGESNWVKVFTENYLKSQSLVSVSGAVTFDGDISTNGSIALTENTTLDLVNVKLNQTGVIRITNDNGWEMYLSDGIVADSSVDLLEIALCDPTDMFLLTYYAGATRMADIWHLQKVTGGNV